MRSVGKGRFEAAIPGFAATTVVQFYVEATDALGVKATFPARGRDSRALYQVNDAQAILGTVHNIRLIMTPGDAAALHALTNVMSNAPMGATVVSRYECC